MFVIMAKTTDIISFVIGRLGICSLESFDISCKSKYQSAIPKSAKSMEE